MKWMKEHDVLRRAFSLLIAIFLWVYVMRVQNPAKTATYDNISVQIEGVSQLTDNDLVILEGANAAVSVKVSGKRDRILNMSREYITASINASSITEPGEYPLNCKVAVDADGITLVSKTPGQIRLVVDRMSSKSVPVKVDFTGELKKDYTVSVYTASPDAITIRGPQTILNKVAAAKVSYDQTELNASVETNVTYVLVDAAGNPVDDSRITADTPATKLSLTVLRGNAVPLTVNFAETDYLTKDMVSYKISPESIQISGSPDVVAAIHQLNLGTVDLESILQSGVDTIEFPIVLPNGVTTDADSPTSATVTISLKSGTTKTLTLTQDALPGNELFTYPAQEIPVLLFGKAELLDSITTENLTTVLSYDVTKLTVGDNEIDATVSCTVSGVHVVDKVKVKVHVSAAALEAAREAR